MASTIDTWESMGTRAKRRFRKEVRKKTARRRCKMCHGPRGLSRTKPRALYCSAKCGRLYREART